MKKSLVMILGMLLLGTGCSFAVKTSAPEVIKTIQISPPIATDDKTIINVNNLKKNMIATMHTSKGDITIQLNENTPKTAENFAKLAKSGYYDGTKFHRVIKGFMNQGGDPLTKDDSKQAMWGTGGPGYQFDDEIGPSNHNAAGTISMANAGPNTNGSQFFLNVGLNDFLDPKHTVFGKITSGMDVVTAINSVRTDGSDRPLEPVVISRVTIVE